MTAAISTETIEAYLELLRQGYGLTMAARELGINAQTIPKLARDNPRLKEMLAEAKVEMIEVLERTAFERAKRSEKSDTLLLALLRAHKPKLYREQQQHLLTDGDGAPLVLTDAQKVARIEALRISALERAKKDDNSDLF